MKRWIVILLVLAAVVVLVSPGIVGRLAERNIANSVSWADRGNDDIAITERKFDRDWFTSEGHYRIEFRNGLLRSTNAGSAGSVDGEAPALIVDTHIDHGLVPVTSMSRKSGSLQPGLASAVSTFKLQTGEGGLIPIPGKLYSQVGLTGATVSRFLLEAGSVDTESVDGEWSGVDATITTDPSDLSIQYEGTIQPLSFTSGDTPATVNVAAIQFKGAMRESDYGFKTGRNEVDIESLRVRAGGGSIGFDSFSLDSNLKLDGDRVKAELAITASNVLTPQADPFDVTLDVAIHSLDARSTQAIVAALQAAAAEGSSRLKFEDVYPSIEDDIKTLLLAGAEFRIDRLDVNLPQGTMTSSLHINLPETGATKDFSWASLLLALTASADVRVPVPLVDMAQAAEPRINSLIAMGILLRDGDYYTVSADYAQGLLTVNGAPMPIPLPGR